jgi:hypothetical protein
MASHLSCRVATLRLTIISASITDTPGQPLDGGQNVMATIGNSGLVISPAAKPPAAAVDALFEKGLVPPLRD